MTPLWTGRQTKGPQGQGHSRTPLKEYSWLTPKDLFPHANRGVVDRTHEGERNGPVRRSRSCHHSQCGIRRRRCPVPPRRRHSSEFGEPRPVPSPATGSGVSAGEGSVRCGSRLSRCWVRWCPARKESGRLPKETAWSDGVAPDPRHRPEFQRLSSSRKNLTAVSPKLIGGISARNTYRSSPPRSPIDRAP